MIVNPGQLFGRTVVPLFLTCLALFLSGCLLGTNSRTTRSGNYVSENTYSMIDPGKTTSAWLKATLGDPNSITKVEDHVEVWKWTYTECRDSSGYVFLLFAGSEQKNTSGAVYAELHDGLVTRRWRD